MSLVLVALFIAFVLCVISIFLVHVVKKRMNDAANGCMYPKGYWFGMGIAFGLLLGMPLGFAIGIDLGNLAIGIAIGPALGIGFGTVIGYVLEKRHVNCIRPLTEEESRLQRVLIVFTISVLVLGVTVLFSLVYLYGMM
ncbi:hypothetical protein HNV12_06770 [Methanococcoides sp. SA1]|nr:hypothetical protein [Methanococcoides sp. SA1]